MSTIFLPPLNKIGWCAKSAHWFYAALRNATILSIWLEIENIIMQNL